MAIKFEDKGSAVVETAKPGKTPPAKPVVPEPADAAEAEPGLPFAKPVKPEKKRRGR